MEIFAKFVDVKYCLGILAFILVLIEVKINFSKKK